MEITKSIIEILFSAALFINALLFIPQAIKIFQSKSGKSISLLTFGGFLFIQLTTVFYGIITHDYFLIIGYIFTMITCGAVVILALMYRNRSYSLYEEDISAEQIIEQLPGHIYWKNKNGVSLGCNTENWKDFGLKSLRDYIGVTDYDLFPKEQADKHRQIDLEVIRKGAPIVAEEESTRADGKIRLYLSHKIPLHNKSQQIIGILGISLDITDTRRKEIERLNILENIIAEMPGHVFWKNKKGVFLGCNNQQAKTLGLSSWQEVVGKTTYDMVWHGQTEEERRKQAMIIDENDRIIMETGVDQVLEEPLILPDGSEAIYLSKKTPLRNEAGEVIGILGVSFDITEKKKTEQQLLETQHKLEGMTLVSATIAHELRTPLASLNLNTNTLKEYLPAFITTYEMAQFAGLPIEPISKDRYKLLDDIITSMELEIRSAFTFIDIQLVNLKPSIVGKGDETFSMINCIQEAVGRYPFEPGERELLHLDAQYDFQVKGKKMLLIHLFFNLIKNALYYIQVADKGEITIWLECSNGYNKVYFKDTGAGIPQSILPEIFDRFFTKTPHGAGIGLTFCKMVMESFNGTITCESVEDEYTIFQLTFPKSLELNAV